MGAVVFTVNGMVGGGMVPLGLGMKPVSKPPAIFTHGWVKVDCVAVWFFCMNMNMTTSPTLAMICGGLYSSFAPPTTTFGRCQFVLSPAKGDRLAVCVAAATAATVVTACTDAAAIPELAWITATSTEVANVPAAERRERDAAVVNFMMKVVKSN